jgi:hypothetical protein
VHRIEHSGQVVLLLLCVNEIPGSNLGLGTNFFDCGFSQSLMPDVGLVP